MEGIAAIAPLLVRCKTPAQLNIAWTQNLKEKATETWKA